MSSKPDIQYDIWALLSEVLTEDGAISLQDLDNMPAIAYNAGRKCDVLTGPCSCGGWHDLTEKRNFTFYGQELVNKHKERL